MSKQDPLAELIKAAAAPGHPHELARATDAVDKLRLMRRASRPMPRPLRRHVRTRSRPLPFGLAVKAAAVLVAVAGTSWALAATIEGLGSDTPVGPTNSFTSSSYPSGAATGTASASPGTSATPSAQPTGSSANPTSTSTPTWPPGFKGQCTAVLAHEPEERDRLLDQDAYAGLVQAAGGKEKVAYFCAALVDGNEERPYSPAVSISTQHSPGRG